MQTLYITLTDEQRAAHRASTGVSFVTSELMVLVDNTPADTYLLVRNMHGLNDVDIKAILEGCDHPLAKVALTVCGGCPVDLRATTLPSCDRLYADC